MAEFKPTADQREVIEHKNGALLVSAAAGSGKTKVLVERLLRRICDPVDPKNVDDFLIITFTQAAAAELRSKIVSEISERLSTEPNNRHLRNQLTRVYLANISTIHAFCADVLREYAHRLHIPADFRVCDETESNLLKQRVLEDLLNAVYDEVESSPEIKAFLDSLGFGRDDRRAASLILEAHKNTQSYAWPEKWLNCCRDYLCRDDFTHISETIWGKFLLEDTRQLISDQISRMQDAKKMLYTDAGLDKYVPVFDDNIALLQRISLHLDWDDLSTIGALDFGRLPPVKECQSPETKAAVQNIRKSCKELVEGRLGVFACDAATALEDQLTTHPALLGLIEMVRRFDESYCTLKHRRHLLDFSDLEHQTVRLVADPYTGGPTASAREIGIKFIEIMVDEYQDTNEAQDTIFRSISRGEENLFMVGDVKQSIYRFRLADPGIFLEKYKRYTTRENDDSASPRKILLSANFRSRPAVIEAVNHVFRTVMSEKVGDLAYTEQEQLSTTLSYPDLGEQAVELHCIASQGGDDESLRREEVEAAFVAERITELLTGEHYISEKDGLRRIKPEDIVILMRATSTAAPIFAETLTARGIPVATDKREDILCSAEVCTILAYLRIIDNPRQDIPLITALSSPAGGFSADELAAIRSTDRQVSFYDALKLEESFNEKVRAFLSELADFRTKRRWMDILELFDYVMLKTNVSNIFAAAKEGAKRNSNLQQLREYCVQCRAVGVDSLAAFLRHIDVLREQNISLPAAERAQTGVTIMTIHKSKGLEFPVVFLCDLFRAFSTEEQRSTLRLDTDLFLACDVVDRKRLARYPSTAKHAVSLKKMQESKSEELRLLYVAMTRAKDRLIMTYCGDSVLKHLQEASMNAGYPAQPCVAANVSNMGKWVLLAAAVRPEASHLFGGAMQMEHGTAYPWKVQFHDMESIGIRQSGGVFADVCMNGTASFRCLDEMSKAYQTPHIPAKLTATELKGRLLDAESAEEADLLRSSPRVQIRERNFDPGNRRLNVLEQGIAMHLFMQYCRYECCGTERELAVEAKRLVQNNLLTPAQAEALDQGKLLCFFRSELGKFVTNADQMRREFKFSLLVDSDEYFPDTEEKLLLQGVVDCFVVTKDGIVILDYKTDRIRPGEEAQRAALYRPQLMAYSKALERIYEMPVCKRIVYFFATDCYSEV